MNARNNSCNPVAQPRFRFCLQLQSTTATRENNIFGLQTSTESGQVRGVGVWVGVLVCNSLPFCCGTKAATQIIAQISRHHSFDAERSFVNLTIKKCYAEFSDLSSQSYCPVHYAQLIHRQPLEIDCNIR